MELNRTEQNRSLYSFEVRDSNNGPSTETHAANMLPSVPHAAKRGKVRSMKPKHADGRMYKLKTRLYLCIITNLNS